jgi:hypothetical protein
VLRQRRPLVQVHGLERLGTPVPSRAAWQRVKIASGDKQVNGVTGPGQQIFKLIKEAKTPMRTLSKALVVAVGMLAIGVLASSVLANSLVVGTFKLSHATQWNGTLLPAGEYQFKLTRTQTDVSMLTISGQKQTLNVMVFAQSACDSCKTEALKMTVQGDNRVVTAMDLPGYHLEFKAPRTETADKEETSPWVEQVSVHVNPD